MEERAPRLLQRVAKRLIAIPLAYPIVSIGIGFGGAIGLLTSLYLSCCSSVSTGIPESIQKETVSNGPLWKTCPFWNNWVKDKHTGEILSGSTLSSNHLYDFYFDLSSLKYSTIPPYASAAQSVEADPAFKDFISQYQTHSLTISVLPIITGRGLQVLPGIPLQRTISIGLDKLRNPPLDCTSHRKFEEFADCSEAGRVTVPVSAEGPGCASVAISVWNDEINQPVDYMVRSVAIAGPTGIAPVCGQPDQKQFYGHLDSFLLRDPQRRVDAALQIFEVAAENPPVVSVAVYMQRNGISYYWQLPENLPDFLTNPRALSDYINRANTNQDFAALYKEFTAYLFPASSTDATAALNDLRGLSGGMSAPSFYARLVDSSGRNLFMPLGLIALDDSDNPTPLGSKVDTVQPLPRESFSRRDQCVNAWSFVLPNGFFPSAPFTLNPGAPATLALFDWPDFATSYVANSTQESTPEGLLLLAHQSQGSFAECPACVPNVRPFQLRRKYAPGSVAVLVACGEGSLDLGGASPGASWLYQLNANGIDTLVMSPFAVDETFGVSFAEHLTKAIEDSSGSHQQLTLWQLLKNTNDSMEQEALTNSRLKAKLNVFNEFVLAGDGNLKVCGAEGFH
jgi:hypothetical protein